VRYGGSRSIAPSSAKLTVKLGAANDAVIVSKTAASGITVNGNPAGVSACSLTAEGHPSATRPENGQPDRASAAVGE
jgi:hypothetical protein